jgi:hypothetical protein
MLDVFFRPVRSILGYGEKEMERPVVQAEHEILDAVGALRQVTESIDHHVEVIEGLATSIDPLKESVNQLTATMSELVALIAPMGKAEIGVQHASQEVRHFLGFRRKKTAASPEPPPAPPAGDAGP